MAHAVIDPNGIIVWKQDPDLVLAQRNPAGGPGRYLLHFDRPCHRDVFVIHAKPEGRGCDAPAIVATTVQSGPLVVCVSTDLHGRPGEGYDCQFSYIRYSRGREESGDREAFGGEGDERRCEELSCEGADFRNLYAWLNLMPIAPPTINLTGEVLVPNPGVDAFLTYKVPQGINPEYLLLDLHLIQRPGIWPQVQTWKPLRFRRPAGGVRYREVDIFCGEDIVARVEVEIAQ